MLVLGAVLSAGLGILLMVLAGGRGLPEGANPRVVQYLSVALQEMLLLGVPALLLWLFFVDHTSRRALFSKPDAVSLGLASLGAVSFVGASVLITALWLSLLQNMGIAIALPGSLENPQGAGEYLLALLCAAVVPAVSEELLFRGLLLHMLRRRMGNRAAAVLSAFLFALLHLSLPGMATLMVIGLFLSLLVIRTGNLWSTMLFHGLYNGVVIVVNALEAQPSLGTVLLFSAVFAAVCWYLVRRKGEQPWN